MKCRFLLLIVTLLLLLGGCTSRQADYFSLFASGFEAELEGEICGVAFCARLECDAAVQSGARPAVLTFYAPQTLADTVLRRSADGSVQLCAGEVAVVATDEYAVLLSLFPTNDPVTDVVKDGAFTRVSGENFTVCFSFDGTPVSVTRDGVHARVISFAQTGGFS